MRYINADQPTFIGYAGEKGATTVSFNLPASWAGKAKDDNTFVLFTLPGTTNTIPYPVKVDGGFAKWVIDDPYICSKHGAGTIQLMLIE